MWRWLVWNLRTLQHHPKILYRYMDRTVKPRTLWTCAGVAVANLHKNMWEKKTFERKKRCEEMTLRLCSTSACMCLHTFAHMPCLKYIAVCCMPCKENCYGSDIVWVLLCEDATHDLREWNTVGHAKTIPTDKYTHTLVAVRLQFAKFPLQYLACGLSDFISCCGLQCGPTVWRCSEHLRAIACSDTVSFSIAMAPLTWTFSRIPTARFWILAGLLPPSPRPQSGYKILQKRFKSIPHISIYFSNCLEYLRIVDKFVTTTTKEI
jgi:hypothetical protein